MREINLEWISTIRKHRELDQKRKDRLIKQIMASNSSTSAKIEHIKKIIEDCDYDNRQGLKCPNCGYSGFKIETDNITNEAHLNCFYCSTPIIRK